MNRVEILGKIQEIIKVHSEDPVTEIRKLGNALVEVANALEGLSREEALRVLRAVYQLNIADGEDR